MNPKMLVPIDVTVPVCTAPSAGAASASASRSAPRELCGPRMDGRRFASLRGFGQKSHVGVGMWGPLELIWVA